VCVCVCVCVRVRVCVCVLCVAFGYSQHDREHRSYFRAARQARSCAR
jgi:hypothetical protein